MGPPKTRVALVAVLASALIALPGCWGYNSSSKGWSYVGNSLLMAGGGGAIALDATSKSEPCAGTGCATYTPPISGLLVAGVLAATAGFVGILFNASRAEAKTTR